MARSPKNVQPGISLLGVGGKSLKSIPAFGKAALKLTLLPLEPGLQVLTGVRIQDSLSEQTYEFNNLMTLLIERE